MLKDRARLEKFIASSRDWTRTLVELGFPDWTCTDFCDFFIEFLEKIHSGVHTEEAVYTILNDDGSANYILMFFRLITSAFLKQNSEEYAPFIDEGMTVAQYCEQEIEPMWKDADHLAINSLIKAAGTRVRIEYMDRTAAPNGGWHYDIPSDDQQIAPEITLLYRPGHYDVIYKKDSTEASEIENWFHFTVNFSTDSLVFSPDVLSLSHHHSFFHNRIYFASDMLDKLQNYLKTMIY